MQFLENIPWLKLLYALLLFLAGLFLAKWLSALAERGLERRFSKHHAMLVGRIVFYLLFLAFAISGLQELGFNLSVILGAAGIFTVALSFASQTAASNLVSGVFLLFERPFRVGDNVQINTVSGTVEAIDLLSTKIRTSDNRLVRVPNEALIKSQITNLSYYGTRRTDILIPVAWKTDIASLSAKLCERAKACPDVLPSPEPQVTVNQFAGSTVELVLMVWSKKNQTTQVTNALRASIKQLFDEEGIDPLSPQISITREAS